ncbi:MAG: HDIG domain-containing protein [Cyclobacteriaceae bacterium]|nr:MAG: HDIG domain-containing protein [Cyclobacteriaceae bacterium]
MDLFKFSGMTYELAVRWLNEWTKSESLLNHAYTVSHVMKMYAGKLGEDQELWAVTGLLHDCDYEAFPEQHPGLIVKKLRDAGEDVIAYAISAHYTKWGNPARSLLDKALLACDELTGFIVACSQVRPDGFNGMKARSVVKKLKQKSFAAKVDRDEIRIGAELLEVPLDQHINFIINALQEYQSDRHLVK